MCLILASPACTGQHRFQYREMHMGSEARIVLYAPDSARAVAAARAAFAAVAELDRALSDYRSDSELSALSRAAGGPARRVSPVLLDVLGKALAVARETDGAFDPTAGPLTEIWRQARNTGRLPDSTSLRLALGRTGWHQVHIDSAAGTVRLEKAGMRLDVGGIAKGYAVDRALEVLRDLGIARALVSLGGEIAVGRAPPGRSGWRIALEPASPDTIDLEFAAVSSSGDTEQFLEVDGVRYSHTIDPRTGQPLTHRLAATVIAGSATDADAWATAATVMDSASRDRFFARRPGAVLRLRGAGVDSDRGPHVPSRAASR